MRPMRPWLILVLAALLIAALALGAWLLGRRSASIAAAVAQTTTVDGLTVTMRLDQALIGSRTIEVAVVDAAGQAVDVSAVQLDFTMVEMDMGDTKVDMQPRGQGRYQAEGPFFTMVGTWHIGAKLERAGQAPATATFAVPIAALGEASGPLNPLPADASTLAAGKLVYQANCAACHGDQGKGDGVSAVGLNPRPADFTQHMIPGKHTDGQIFLWVKDGVPGTAMPAWGSRLSEEQLWQVVTYLRGFGTLAAVSTPSAQPSAPGLTPGALAPATPTVGGHLQAPPDSQEPLPPLVFTRMGNIWYSDGSGAAPRQLTSNAAETYAQNPVLSPDGKQVAFIALVQPSATAQLPVPTSVLYVMGLDGSNLRKLWDPGQGLMGLPTWAADGQSIYVAANGITTAADGSSTRYLHVMHVLLSSGAAQAVLTDVLDPSISHDGKQMVYLKLAADGYTLALAVAAPDGSSERILNDGKSFQGLYAPRFSPDGKQIVLAAIGGPETDGQGYPVGQPTPSGSAPLDRLLGLLEPPSAEAHGLPWDLWSINADGSGLRRITAMNEDMPMVAFSPDGKQMVAMGAGGIYLMNPDGSNLRRIDRQGDHGGLDWAAR